MATPPNPTDGNPQNPVPEAVNPMDNDQQEADKGPAKETSIFINREPIREEQVQNAVKFLSHPKVKGSPVMYRRSFLERKGLTKEEIDESFRRVPDESSGLSTTQPVVADQGGQSQPTSNIQPQPQSLQPVAAAPGSKLTASRFHWSHGLLAVGVLAISGAGTAVLFKNSIVPRLKSWIRKVVHEDEEEDLENKTNKKPTLAEEATAAAKAATTAASDVARASQEMLVSKSEEKKYFGELLSLLDVQVQEMKSMSNSIRKLEARSLSPPPTPVEPSYMEVNSMIQRDERPPNIREINDLPPNPNQSVSNPRLAPNPKHWEAAQSQGSSTYAQNNGSGPASVYPSYGDRSASWRQQKNIKINEIESEENKTGGTNERPVQRSSWVPPQPPPVAMAEAAAAIRQQKKTSFEKEQQLTDEKLLTHSTDVTDELQRITKMSELGGVVPDVGVGSSVVTESEIRREDDCSYFEG